MASTFNWFRGQIKIKSKVKLNNVFLVLVLLGVFIVIFTLNLKTMYTADDYIYRFIYHTASPFGKKEKIDGLTTIAISQWNHYFNWNGRFVAHSIVQFFMQYNKIVFDIFNTFAFIGLGLMINGFSRRRSDKHSDAIILFIVFAFLWFFIPEFGKSALWVSGSGNYLWTSLIYLSFIMMCSLKKDTNVLLLVGSIIAGFLAGATNENSGPASALIVMLMMLLEYLKDKKFYLWKLFSVIASLIGSIVMVMSPGSQARGHMSMTLGVLLGNFKNLASLSIHSYWIPYVALLVLYICAYRQRKLLDNSTIMSFIFLIGHFASVYSLILSPEAPPRTLFGSTVFLGIAIFMVVYDLNKSTYSVALKYILAVALLGLFLRSGLTAYRDVNYTNLQVTQEYRTITDAKKVGKDTVTVKLISEPKSLYNAFDGTAYLQKDPGAWMNLWVANYFGMKSISGK
ncbi:DUF3329 domain-containing protein [Companilactobacillus nodensis]|nr:DUF6056 family protein [Companilactobacillus nodensis]